MGRAYGSNAQLLLKKETVYGVKPGGNFIRMPFTSSELGSEQGLIKSPVLGYGRDPAQPFLDAITVDGDIGVPIDPRYIGLWLAGVLGVPTSAASKAKGTMVFTTIPAAGQTISVNGTVFTFVTGASSGTNIGIKANTALTVAEIVTVLNASAVTGVAAATYSQDAGSSILTILHDTAGAAGNNFTLAASSAAVSGATLTGGGTGHVFTSGQTSLPSYTLERGMPDVPAFFQHTGVVFNSIAFDFQRSGAATATVNAIAQGEARTNASQGGSPSDLALNLISQSKGSLKSGGAFIANLTSANVTYSNNMEKIETIRDDGKIDGADPTVASLTGTFECRFADTTFIDKAASGTPIDLEFAYILTPGQMLTLTAHEVYLPKPKIGVSGPGGVNASFSFEGARNATVGRMLTVTLVNDLDGSVYQ